MGCIYQDEKTWKHEIILHRVETEALAVAAEKGPADDAHWRGVARDARRSSHS